ncbi:hypothetical protein AX774_g2563 [Zancudomyces culisetae]|uniref:Kaptin n=1 Tax=Zancudomyces culisetae TaxID=1213189 RepID=A0A1R1PSR1_ZANCU|nr:hypothetical protein AX774_g2563 [Zancudomyces culisetae]|eukprot:OMH83922.1 hypothetical protein AX774_g2563 [Zancudomyces culisetae]
MENQENNIVEKVYNFKNVGGGVGDDGNENNNNNNSGSGSNLGVVVKVENPQGRISINVYSYNPDKSNNEPVSKEILKDSYEFKQRINHVYVYASKGINLVTSIEKYPIFVIHDIEVMGLLPVDYNEPVEIPEPKNTKNTKNTKKLVGGCYSLDFEELGMSETYGQISCISKLSNSNLNSNSKDTIMFGTHSGFLLIYKYIKDKNNDKHHYALVYKRLFKSNIYKILSVDINLDGVAELLVVTLCGVYVLQPNLFGLMFGVM